MKVGLKVRADGALTPIYATVAKNVTLDLSGQELYSFSDDGRLVITGNLTVFADGSGNDEDRDALSVPITVKRGGRLIVPAKLNDVENKLTIKNPYGFDDLAIESGGSMQLDGGTCDRIEVSGGEITVDRGSINVLLLQKGSTLGINSGSIKSLTLINQSAVTISDGSFGSIQIYETYFDENGHLEEVWPHEVTYADFAALLTDGKAFKLTNADKWANDSDVDKPFSSGAKYKMLSSVSVADAPIKSLTIDGVSSVQYGTTAVLSAKADAGENQLTYQWYQVTDSGRTPIDGAVSSTYTVPTSTLGSNTYAVEADCNGYRVCSEPFEVMVTPRVLKLPIIEDGTDTKEYDGTTDTVLKITGFYADTAKKEPVTLTEGVDFTLDSAAYESPSVGEKGNNIQYKITLKKPNYTFENGMTMIVLSGGHITQATAPKAENGSLTVANDQSAVYTFDFKSLLPVLDEPKTFGTVTYTLGDVRLPNYYDYTNPAAELNDGVLTLPIKANNTTYGGGTIGLVAVQVTTQNYQEFILTLRVTASDKKLPILDGESCPYWMAKFLSAARRLPMVKR